MPRPVTLASGVTQAAVAALLMIAFQVAGRAVRDALFLSNFEVAHLPRMAGTAALVSMAAAALATRVLQRQGPFRLLPRLLAISAVLLLAEWSLAGPAPRTVAFLFYLHFAALGAVSVAGFWVLVNERFDPRTARFEMSRIVLGASLGALAGGFIADGAARVLTLPAMLPILAVLHGAAALVTRQMGRPRHEREATGAAPAGPAPEPEPLRSLLRRPYLAGLVTLAVVGTVTEELLDYVFKMRAAAVRDGAQLLSLFAMFYTAVAFLTVVAQALLGGRVLRRLGPARAVAVTPAAVGVGASGLLLAGGLAPVLAVRGLESVLRQSVFRPAYELLYVPLGPRVKRRVKVLVDVIATRAGDLAAAGLVQIAFLALAEPRVAPALLALTVAGAIATLLVAGRLQAGYRATLAGRLRERAEELDVRDIGDPLMVSTVLGMIPAVALPESEPAASAPDPSRAPRAAVLRSDLTRLSDLTSKDEVRVRGALAAEPLDNPQAAAAVQLLGWDAVSASAAGALRAVAKHHVGMLVDHLLDPDEAFSVRRRIPALLGVVRDARAVDGLFAGLGDRRFEVRYRCGRALARLCQEAPDLRPDRARVVRAIARELAVDRGVWESYRLLDHGEDELVDEVVRDRAGRGLEHVFTLLSLVVEREPLWIAYRGVHTSDPVLRGTSLEYLESALPPDVWRGLGPFLEPERRPGAPGRPRAEVLAELLRSNASIMANLEELRRRAGQGGGPAG